MRLNFAEDASPMLYADIPTVTEFKALAEFRADACVSLFIPTTPVTQESGAERITLGNLAKRAYAQLVDAGLDKRRLALLEEQIADLIDDVSFWRYQSNSLVVLATPDVVMTFRLPSHLSESVQVSDRFHLKPLMRAITFPHEAMVLAVSQNSVRLVHVFADLPPVEVVLHGLTQGAADALGRATLKDHAPSGRIQGGEGQKVLLRQYARYIDTALRGVMSGRDTPLLIAAAEPLASIVRSVISYPALAATTIALSPDRASDQELADAARPILDGLHAAELEAARAVIETRIKQGRATTDLSEVARAATFGAIELLLVDMDTVVPGTIDTESGVVTLATSEGASTYGVIDEIVSRALLTGARVMAVRKADLPEGVQLQAAMRYALKVTDREAARV